MKKTTNKLKILGALSIASLSLLTFAQVSAWGPDRATFTMEQPATYPTFNSITNNPTIGDERNFVRIGQINSDVTDLTDEVEVLPGHQYLVYVYFHNNASATFNDKAHNYSGVATKTRMASAFSTVLTPNERGKVSAVITAENTNPESVLFTTPNGALLAPMAPRSTLPARSIPPCRKASFLSLAITARVHTHGTLETALAPSPTAALLAQ